MSFEVPVLKSYNYEDCLNKVVKYVFGEKAGEITHHSGGVSIMSTLEAPNMSG